MFRRNQQIGIVMMPTKKTKKETITIFLALLFKRIRPLSNSHEVPTKPPTMNGIPHKALPKFECILYPSILTSA